jgi:hypothetical protein
MTQPVTLFSLQPTLDVPALARIRYPSWLKNLYNIAQMELTTLDPLGAFYLVARDVNWNIRPKNQTQQGGIRPRPNFTTFFKAVLKPNSESDQNFMLLSWLALASPSNTPLIPNTPSALVLSLLYHVSWKVTLCSVRTLTKDEITTTIA